MCVEWYCVGGYCVVGGGGCWGYVHVVLCGKRWCETGGSFVGDSSGFDAGISCFCDIADFRNRHGGIVFSGSPSRVFSFLPIVRLLVWDFLCINFATRTRKDQDIRCLRIRT